MKPEIEVIEVKPGVYVVKVDPRDSVTAVYWRHQDGSTVVMKSTKRNIDYTKKTSQGKQVSITNAQARRAEFQLIKGGLYEERRCQVVDIDSCRPVG